MSLKPTDFDQWIEALAPALRLEITQDYRPGVKANLKTAEKMAALLDKADLPELTEPAPVFRA